MEILQQLSETIDNFRYFTEPPKTEMEFDVKDIIEKSITLISPSFKLSFIQLENKLEKDCYLYGSPREFSSVLLNILNNARDILERKKIANPKVKIKLSQVEEKVVIKISDNAGWIPFNIIDKIFESGFINKEKDFGFGLFIAKNIIEKKMNAKLSVRNTKEGAEFRIEV